MSNKKILIATGGSGGHIIPGLAIAKELKENNFDVEFIGSGGGFSHLVEEQGFVFHQIKAFKYTNRGFFGKIKALIFTYLGVITALFQIRKINPVFVLGLGSYASIATVLAAKISGIETAIHEQNVKPGRTNKILMNFADRVFLSFEETKQFLADKVNKKNEFIVTGCPVEQKVLDAEKIEREKDSPFTILVLGGSQGARILSDVVPQAIITLPEEIKKNIKVIQQSRPEDIKRVEQMYQEYNINYEINSYFDDVPLKTRQANLIIARSGAGTVCETSVLGRVAIFVPLLLADGHQMENARILTDKNASFILETGRFTPANLAYEIIRLAENPQILESMEENSYKAVSQSRTAAKQICKEITEVLS